MGSSPLNLGVLGAGAVARILAERLQDTGVRVRLWARDAEAARLAAPEGVEVAQDLDALGGVQVVLVCVADRAIGEVAQRLADEGPARVEGAVALHTSGYHGPEVLAPLEAAGWSVGVLHPLVSFPRGTRGPERLDGAWYSIEGTPEACSAGADLVRRLGGHVLPLARGQRAAYHAAATLAANGLVGVVDLALEALGEAAPRDDARRALAHLLRTVLQELEERETGPTLSGPIPRGDAAVVAGHLETLVGEPRRAYLLIARRALKLARANGGTLAGTLADTPGEALAELERLLEGDDR